MLSLHELQSQIRKSGLDWEAGNTPASRDYAAGKTQRFGFAPTPREPSGGPRRGFERQTFAFAAGSFPSSVDWREVEGANYVTSVGDQGQCGSCVAFSVCAVLESRAKIHKEDAYFSIELSKAHLFFCGTKNGCEAGWAPANALKFCREHGVGLERHFPYQGSQQSCKEIGPVIKVPRWRRISDHHEEGRKAIIRRGPVVGGMVVYSDFLFYRSGIYRPVTTQVVGLHAVTIIGFDDEKGCWLIKNSWGSAWGEGGYARVGYGTCGIDAQFPFYDPEVALVPA
jgi:C1A family cysteine protease